MSDTIPGVMWSLERRCPLRAGDDWFLPGRTLYQLDSIQTVDTAENERRNFDGFCVRTSLTVRDHSGKPHQVPECGFQIPERVAAVGGMPEVRSICGGCEANVEDESPTGSTVARCAGFLFPWPDRRRLYDVVEQRGLKSRLRTTFPVTMPLWYGFWIESPLNPNQVELLHEILRAAYDDSVQCYGVVHFLNALQASLKWNLPLHVSLSPPGHVDMGWVTTFVHCPRCKAGGPFENWQREYPKTLHTCEVCGHRYVPDDNRSSEEDEEDEDVSDKLEDQLGAQYEPYVRGFLAHRGCDSAQIEEVIDGLHLAPLCRRIESVRTQRRITRQHFREPREVKHPRLPATVSVPLSDEIDLEMVLVPAGEFLMGSPNPNDLKARPQHLVQFRWPFYIGRSPITQAQWLALMAHNPSKFQTDPQLPVDQVNWFDCQEYCERLCRETGKPFRLPSEAEWEYACRAGTTAPFAFGEELTSAQARIRVQGALERSQRHLRRPSVVGSYPPNAWGICDMHGNVLEWCDDAWHPDYAGAPGDGRSWYERAQPFGVARGGWFWLDADRCTSFERYQVRADAGEGHAEKKHPDPKSLLALVSYDPYGFRVACDPPLTD